MQGDDTMKNAILGIFIAAGLCGATEAKVDLVTLPSRDTVQLTIYNSADMTLVREARDLTLASGANRLQFSWENTLIDPTSLEMLPKANADKIDISDLTYPPRVRNLGLWNIESGVSGKVPVEITYLTSGLSWRAFYMGTLSDDERTMRLQGYVRVTNNSGEDYENAQTRLIVGQVHVLDQIAELAQRQYPYGSPVGQVERGYSGRGRREEAMIGGYGGGGYALAPIVEELERKAIEKEGLSEYFLYTIEGSETIANGWSKRLLSFDVDEVPVVNLYKYEEERYGNAVMRFLSFKNDEEHKLGETPIPGGMLKVYRNVDDDRHLGYVGQSEFKYIPVDEDVELNLGAVADIVVEPKLMEFSTDNYTFDTKGNIDGWDEMRKFEVEVRNTRDIGVEVEIQRNFDSSEWELKRSGDFGQYENVDVDTVKFTLKLEAGERKKFEYVLTTRRGEKEVKPLSSDNPADAATEKQLDEVVSLLGLQPEMTFVDALEIIKNSVNPPLKIIVNWRDLEDNAGVDQQALARMDAISSVPVRKAVDLLLEKVSGASAELGFVVTNGIIAIATRDSLPGRYENRVYDIAEIMSAGLRGMGQGDSGMQSRKEDLYELLTETVEPDSWFDNGGEGTLSFYENRRLVVRQTPEVHEKISKLLEEMRRMQRKGQ